jgi:hypothetical protein
LPASNDDVLVRVKDWEIIADNLKEAGRSWGWVSAIDSRGRTFWIVGAHRDDESALLCKPMRN